MDTLVELLTAYRKTNSLEGRLELAEKIIGEVYTPLRFFIWRRISDDIEEDVFNVTLQAIAKGLLRAKAKNDREFLGWCYRIARNKIADAHRAGYRDREDYFDPEILMDLAEVGSEPVESNPGDRADIEHYLNLLKKIDFPCAQLLRNYIEIENLEVIAEMYETTYHAVRMQVHRCLKSVEAIAAKHRSV